MSALHAARLNVGDLRAAHRLTGHRSIGSLLDGIVNNWRRQIISRIRGIAADVRGHVTQLSRRRRTASV